MCRESLQNFLKLADDFDVSVTETLDSTPKSKQAVSCNEDITVNSSALLSIQSGPIYATKVSQPDQCEVK